MTNTKVCSSCGRELPLDQFHRSREGIQARRAKCKECRLAHVAHLRKINPEPHRRASLKHYYRFKDKVLRHIGGEHPQCAVCPFDMPELLEIDHINNDGKEDRRKVGAVSKIYYVILKMSEEEARKRYQLLCVLHHKAKTKGINVDNLMIVRRAS